MTKRNRLNAQSVVIISRPDLRLEWCSHAAAKYAVEHWHYSKRMPKSKLAKIGIWEDGQFIGAVIYGVGATAALVQRFGLTSIEGAELVRVALRNHTTEVSRILSLSLRLVRHAFPGLKLLVSFADPEYGHSGIIYQASGWVYTGMTASSPEYIVNGKRWHGRALRHEKPAHLTTIEAASKLDSNYMIVLGSSKHRYLYPLDASLKEQIASLSKPYPKRPKDSSEPPAIHAGEGGAAPTRALQNLFPLRDRMSRLVTG